MESMKKHVKRMELSRGGVNARSGMYPIIRVHASTSRSPLSFQKTNTDSACIRARHLPLYLTTQTA